LAFFTWAPAGFFLAAFLTWIAPAAGSQVAAALELAFVVGFTTALGLPVADADDLEADGAAGVAGSSAAQNNKKRQMASARPPPFRIPLERVTLSLFGDAWCVGCNALNLCADNVSSRSGAFASLRRKTSDSTRRDPAVRCFSAAGFRFADRPSPEIGPGCILQQPFSLTAKILSTLFCFGPLFDLQVKCH
jgi:hypothetical protein